MIELKDEVSLPEGTRVSVIPEESAIVSIPEHPLTLKEWLRETRRIREQLPGTGDSVEILRQLREDRAGR